MSVFWVIECQLDYSLFGISVSRGKWLSVVEGYAFEQYPICHQ